ncbi:GDP-L-fucose synthase family protein [Selenomonas sp. oral taxon 136]|uniref:GDP-L-fucose synthase family protein n=1 Tax=Selenomonas sp. oral taxon 136 TaxID=713030 RepID=UPI0007682324|nr:GDP-L-fucose synthase [Selenomonas sp. oral taxon 136]AME04188.1 GDP-fucose synthetase [Selenomonas sp. oral taxon 136]
MKISDKIYVAGHTGMVGSAIVRHLQKLGYNNLLLRTHRELDLTDQQATKNFFEQERPDYVFIAAAKVGGIQANSSFPADFLYVNLMINANIIHAAHEVGVKKLLALGSSCIYPKFAEQPIREEALLDGKPEPTNEGYAIAKISALELVKFFHRQYNDPFISCMPTNIYGENDNFDLQGSHVIPAMIRKFHTAKVEGADSVTLWGTGSPKREFLYVDDLADACVFLMENYDEAEHINIGSGEEVSMKALAEEISSVVGFEGALDYDTEKPDGAPRRLVDSTRIHELGWKHKVMLREGLERSYRYFLNTCVDK